MKLDLSFSVSFHIIDPRVQWIDYPDSKTLFVTWPGMPRPLLVFQGASYDAWITAGGTEDEQQARVRELAAAGAIAALYAPPVIPTPVVRPPSPPVGTPGAGRAAIAAAAGSPTPATPAPTTPAA